jgi:hypothetical protein
VIKVKAAIVSKNFLIAFDWITNVGRKSFTVYSLRFTGI